MDPFKSIAQKEMQRNAEKQRAQRGKATERHVPDAAKKPEAKATSTASNKKPTQTATPKKQAETKEVILKPPVEGYSASENYIDEVLLK